MKTVEVNETHIYDWECPKCKKVSLRAYKISTNHLNCTFCGFQIVNEPRLEKWVIKENGG